MLFELKKLIDYLSQKKLSLCGLYTWQFSLSEIYCMFCSDLWETFNIMKSTFGECKDGQGKLWKRKLMKCSWG